MCPGSDLLDTLASATAAAGQGTPQLVLVEGPPGCGKSTLIRHFAANFEGKAVWLTGFPGDEERPLRMFEFFQAAAARVLGDTSVSVVAPDDPIKSAAVVGTELVRRLVGSQSPVLVVVDDAQWFDPQSLAAAAYVFRQQLDLRMICVMIIRTQDPRIPRDTVERLRRLGELPNGSIVRLGERGPGDGGGLLATLTPREREIAVMAANGARNREVAAALSVNVKTVESHLAHVFRKLGVSSRVELGRLFALGGEPRSP